MLVPSQLALAKRILIGAIAVQLVACNAAEWPTRPPLEVAAPLLSLDPSYGTRYFYLTGFSYGPEFEEYDSGSCHGTYSVQEDSVEVWSGTPKAYITQLAFARTGCSISQPTDGPYVGGNINYYISNSSVSGSVLADGAEDEWLYDVPQDPNASLYLTAYANYGYTFLHWIVTPTSGGAHFVSSSTVSVPLNSSDWHFHAEFQKSP